jgi:precorrin-6B methylase 1
MSAAAKGTVYLVGAGPGDPELLTLKAAGLLRSADLVLHDDLVPAAVIAMTGGQALVVSVGKRCGVKRVQQREIHTLMIEAARQRLSVVRLKSGDPLVFGRAAEEMDALRAADVPFEVVPGITAAFAAAAQIGCSLTDRRVASSIEFHTGHKAADQELPSQKAATEGVCGGAVAGRGCGRAALLRDQSRCTTGAEHSMEYPSRTGRRGARAGAGTAADGMGIGGGGRIACRRRGEECRASARIA